jgi:hypothetical protein
MERLFHFVKLERFDDRFDLLHLGLFPPDCRVHGVLKFRNSRRRATSADTEFRCFLSTLHERFPNAPATMIILCAL